MTIKITKAIYHFLCTRAFFLMLAVLVGSLLFFIRNPVNFILPTVYAEDGTWTALIYNYGLIYAIKFARPDYYVFGNLAALWIGIKCCYFFDSGDLYNLPRWYALISYFIYALTASLPIIFLKNYLRPIYLFLLWLLLCFIPLGCNAPGGHEVIGRLSNIGFLFLYIGFILILYRFDGARSFFEFLITDFLLIICAFTNPICTIYLAPWFISEICCWKQKTITYIKTKIALRVFTILAFSFIGLKIILSPQKKDIISSALSLEKIVEIGIVRNILYPIAYSFYSHFGIILAILLLLITVFLFFRFSDKKSAYVFLFGAGVLILTSLVLLKIRPDLRNYALHFTSTYPDRYYYGQNMISITLFVLLIQNILSTRIKSFFRISLGVVLFSLLFSSVILEFPKAVSSAQLEPIIKGFLFKDCLKRAIENQSYVDIDGKPNSQGAFIKIDIFPSGWFMVLPISKIKSD